MFDYNNFYDCYAKTKNPEKLLAQLKVALYFDYKVFFKTDRDTASDFYCEAFKNLKRKIEKFDCKRASFFTYLTCVIKKDFYNFQRKKMQIKNLQLLCEEGSKVLDLHLECFIENFYKKLLSKSIYDTNKFSDKSCADFASDRTCDFHLQYGNFKVQKKLFEILEKLYFNCQRETRNKKIAEKILVCKHAWKFDEFKILHLCKLLGLDENCTFEFLDKIKELMEKRLNEQKVLENKINGYFYKKEISKKFLSEAQPESYKFLFYKMRKQKNEKHLESSARKYLTKSMHPTNKMLSEVLDLSYPTVTRWVKKISDTFKNFEKLNEI